MIEAQGVPTGAKVAVLPRGPNRKFGHVQPRNGNRTGVLQSLDDGCRDTSLRRRSHVELPSHSSWIAQCDEKCPCEQAPLHAAVHGVGRPRMLGRRLSLAKLLLLHQSLLRSSTLPEVSPHASGRLRPHPATSFLHDGWHSLFRLDQPLVLTILHSLTQVPAVPAQHGNRPASYQIG